jgi:meiotically up-regulated gene 157 (Mug157) protein
MPQNPQRPESSQRKFVSPKIEQVIELVCSKLRDQELAVMFENCFPNTLDTTVEYSESQGVADTFVITGDIDAMWLRDSAAQIHPYLQFTHEAPELLNLFIGMINRQVKCILLDPYANAFYKDPVFGEWKSDQTEMRPGVHERKWELDSLCYFLRLSCNFYEMHGAQACFNHEWKAALESLLALLKREKDQSNTYVFSRRTCINRDTLALDGICPPSRPCGMIRSAFRPSDDACTLPFLIPSNCMASHELMRTKKLCLDIFKDESLAQQCHDLSHEIENGIQLHGFVNHSSGQKIYAYEADGYGSCMIMDDANIPSLLALPYLGYCTVDDPVYQATRAVLLSADNPCFYHGQHGEGIGGPHVGPNYVWPMSIIMRALTSVSDREITDCLNLLKTTHAGTGFMHESFHVDDPNDYTRGWFGWVNSLFGELILKLLKERPHLL